MAISVPFSTAWTVPSIRSAVLFDASEDLLARLRTSSATTANPFPAAPARAASTAALSARILVWNAISSMVFVILLILEDLSLISEEKEYLLEKDDVFLIDCRKEHEYRALSQSGWGYRFIHFDGGMMAGYYQQIMNGGNMKFHFDEKSDFQNQFKKLFKLCRENEAHKEIIVNLTLTQMITEILCQLTQYQTQEIPGGIIKQCGYIREHCCGKLGLEDLAKEFRLSKFHMSREFKKYTGKTIYEYITECRIAVAQRLLRYSDMPVGEIAEYVGFEDHNGFYRTFRQKEEVSPSVYRKNWRLL